MKHNIWEQNITNSGYWAQIIFLNNEVAPIKGFTTITGLKYIKSPYH